MGGQRRADRGRVSGVMTPEPQVWYSYTEQIIESVCKVNVKQINMH